MRLLTEELPHHVRSSPCFIPVFPSLRWDAAPCMRHLVPQTDHRIRPIMFVPKRAETGRVQQEVPARSWGEPEPARGEHPEEVPAREEQSVPVDFPRPAYHAVGPRSDQVWRLPPGAAVPEQLPIGALGVDLGARAAFVRPVIPFTKIRIDFSRRAEAGQLA